VQVIMNCLHKDPAVRPADIREIATAIDANAAAQRLFITPPSTQPRPTGISTATSKSPRQRFSKEFYIVMVALAALLVIAAVTLWIVLKR